MRDILIGVRGNGRAGQGRAGQGRAVQYVGWGGACSLKRVDFIGTVTRRPRLETITQDE